MTSRLALILLLLVSSVAANHRFGGRRSYGRTEGPDSEEDRTTRSYGRTEGPDSEEDRTTRSYGRTEGPDSEEDRTTRSYGRTEGPDSEEDRTTRSYGRTEGPDSEEDRTTRSYGWTGVPEPGYPVTEEISETQKKQQLDTVMKIMEELATMDKRRSIPKKTMKKINEFEGTRTTLIDGDTRIRGFYKSVKYIEATIWDYQVLNLQRGGGENGPHVFSHDWILHGRTAEIYGSTTLRYSPDGLEIDFRLTQVRNKD